jgi:alkylated DNA repair protein alkB family protein 7
MNELARPRWRKKWWRWSHTTSPAPSQTKGTDKNSTVVFVANAISEFQQQKLLAYLEPLLAKRTYIGSHWDDVIVQYKEIEMRRWTDQECAQIIATMQSIVAPYTNSPTFLPAHVIDLSAEGYIQAHVDSVKFSGGVVAGLSLLSSRILCLHREGATDVEQQLHDSIELLLPPRSLYILHGPMRYEYTHSILGPDDKPRGCLAMPKCERRLSIMFRDVHPNDSKPETL